MANPINHFKLLVCNPSLSLHLSFSLPISLFLPLHLPLSLNVSRRGERCISQEQAPNGGARDKKENLNDKVDPK